MTRLHGFLSDRGTITPGASEQFPRFPVEPRSGAGRGSNYECLYHCFVTVNMKVSGGRENWRLNGAATEAECAPSSAFLHKDLRPLPTERAKGVFPEALTGNRGINLARKVHRVPDSFCLQ
jgi:hypothetical protein